MTILRAAAEEPSGDLLEVEHHADECVTLFRNGAAVCDLRWDRHSRRLRGFPDDVPPITQRVLSQRLKVALTGSRIAAEEAKLLQIDWVSLEQLFARRGFPGLPKHCSRWARARIGSSIFTVFVIAEDETIVYRNWTMLGKCRWDYGVFVDHESLPIPTRVWEHLTKAVASFGQPPSTRKRPKKPLRKGKWPRGKIG